MKVALVSGLVVDYDAISNAVLHERQVLREAGHQVTVFCQGTTLAGDRSVVTGSDPWAMWRDPRYRAADLVVLHFGTGYELFDVLQLPAAGAARAVRFHNVTPPHLLAGAAAERARWGLDQVVAAELAERTWCDSEFNRCTLHDLGADPATTSVLELCVPQVDELARTGPPPLPDGPPQVLYVGRMVGAKGIDDLLSAFDASGLAARGTRLVVAGNSSLSDAAAVARVRAARGRGVVLVDRPADARLEELYAASAVFVMPSHHEGFCIPVVEAQARGLRVVATDAGALPETVAGDGTVVAAQDPAALAQALVDAVGAAAADGRPEPDRARLGRYSFESFRTRFTAAVDDLVAVRR